MIGYLEKKKKKKASCDWCIISLSSGNVTHPYKSGRNGLLIESKHSLVGEREWRVQTKETRFYIAHKRNVPVFSGKYIQ